MLHAWRALIESRLRSRWFVAASLTLMIAAATVVRLSLTGKAEHPGHGDQAFYYTVAENVADGRGLEIDYIWNYLNDPQEITHTSLGFWTPLTSLIIAASFLVFGVSLFAALLPSILFGLALAVPTYFLARVYSDSQLVAISSAGLVLFVPHLLTFSLLTDSAIYYALFISFALLFMIKGWTNPKLFIAAAAFCGLAHLTRQDGILSFATLSVVVLLAPLRRKTKLVYWVAAFGVYLLIIAPLLVANYRVFGTPSPPGPAKMAYLTSYENHYSVSAELNLRSYLDWGMRNIVWSKLSAAIGAVRMVFLEFLGAFIRTFVVVALLQLALRKDRWKTWAPYLPPLLFLAALISFYSLVVTVGSGVMGFTRSSVSLIPFFVVLAVDGAERNIRPRAVVLVLIALMFASGIYRGIATATAELDRNARIGERLSPLRAIVEGDSVARDGAPVVIMTRDPWEVYHTTRFKAIQIPNDDLETIVSVGERFGANYLLLPAPRDALQAIYHGDRSDERFVHVADLPDSDMRLFRIDVGRE